MKKVILFIVLIFSIITISAQNKGDFEMGGNIGLNLSTVSSIDNNDAADAKVQYNIGASLEYYFSDSWGIKTKLIYDNKGWANGFFENLDTNEIFITDYRLSYVTVPVMANWHFGSRKNWYLNFGAYLGFLSSAEATDINIEAKEFFTSTDFGLTFGVGYRVLLNDKLTLYFEYDEQAGLLEIFDNPSSNSTTRNSRSSFNIGLLFLLNN